jgi:mono/diheme cytochrome c family protein
MSTSQQKFLQRALILFLITGALTGFYFAFRYTLIADVREAIANPDTADQVAYGATLFQTRGCVSCHTLESAGAAGDEGPNLTGIASRHDDAYIRQSIVEPNAVIAPQCPEGACQAGIMPQFGSILSPDQIDALVAYLLEQR